MICIGGFWHRRITKTSTWVHWECFLWPTAQILVSQQFQRNINFNWQYIVEFFLQSQIYLDFKTSGTTVLQIFNKIWNAIVFFTVHLNNSLLFLLFFETLFLNFWKSKPKRQIGFVAKIFWNIFTECKIEFCVSFFLKNFKLVFRNVYQIYWDVWKVFKCVVTLTPLNPVNLYVKTENPGSLRPNIHSFRCCGKPGITIAGIWSSHYSGITGSKG